MSVVADVGPAQERAALAAAGLDGEADPDAAAAWHAEIKRRAELAQADDWSGVAWEEVRAEIERDVLS